jgi:hypothetical protein
MLKLLVPAFLCIKIKKKILKLLVPVFLQIKLKKNAETINSGIFTSEIEKNAKTISSSILICKNFFKKILKLLVQYFYK